MTIKFYWLHKNLGEFGLQVGNRYFGITFPHREGWGYSWKELIRVYWENRFGQRQYLFLPGLRRVSSR